MPKKVLKKKPAAVQTFIKGTEPLCVDDIEQALVQYEERKARAQGS